MCLSSACRVGVTIDKTCLCDVFANYQHASVRGIPSNRDDSDSEEEENDPEMKMLEP